MDEQRVFATFPILETRRLILRELRSESEDSDDVIAAFGILSDPRVMQYTGRHPHKTRAESLAVVFYTAILKNFHTFRHPKLTDRDYFAAALKNEKAHKQFLADALGSKTPTGLRFRIPPKAVRTGQSLLNTGVALETAFVAAYLGASNTLSSPDLRLVAARVAANEASHFSFFDAAAGGHGVLPALPKTDTIPNTVKKLQPFLA